MRVAVAEDLECLVEFNLAMAQETEGLQLDPERLRAGIRGALLDPIRGRYFVAQRGNEALGALMLTSEWSDWRNAWFWWVQSVYVLPDARQMGVFRQLYHAVMERARGQRDVAGIRLYVERSNVAAQAVYQALGMAASHYEMYEFDLASQSGTCS